MDDIISSVSCDDKNVWDSEITNLLDTVVSLQVFLIIIIYSIFYCTMVLMSTIIFAWWIVPMFPSMATLRISQFVLCFQWCHYQENVNTQTNGTLQETFWLAWQQWLHLVLLECYHCAKAGYQLWTLLHLTVYWPPDMRAIAITFIPVWFSHHSSCQLQRNQARDWIFGGQCYFLLMKLSYPRHQHHDHAAEGRFLKNYWTISPWRT